MVSLVLTLRVTLAEFTVLHDSSWHDVRGRSEMCTDVRLLAATMWFLQQPAQRSICCGDLRTEFAERVDPC
jgi:hypothetical protein